MTIDRAANPGGAVTKTKGEELPHAASFPLQPSVHQAAIVAGVADADGRQTERERDAVAAAKGAIADRDPLPMVVRDAAGGFTGLNGDPMESQARMMATMGTNSAFFVASRLTELRGMLTKPGEESDPTLMGMNDGVALIASIAPTDELEALLATQMAGAHALSCEMLSKAMRSTNPDQVSTFVNCATKLQRTFTAQIEALAKMRGKGQQTVRVEHVTVESGAQAIVGDVHHHPTPKDRTHAATDRARSGATLPGPDPFRNGMPLGSDEERPVPNARRRQHRRTPRKPERP